MMYMLDTNAVIMAVRHPDWPICGKIKKHIGKDLCISAVTYGELVYGIQKSSAPERNRIAITQILLGIRILSFDDKAAEHFGDIFADLEKRHQHNNTNHNRIQTQKQNSKHRSMTLIFEKDPVFVTKSERNKEIYLHPGKKVVILSISI